MEYAFAKQTLFYKKWQGGKNKIMKIVLIALLVFAVAYFLLLVFFAEAKFFLAFKRHNLFGKVIQEYVYAHKKIYKIDKNFDKKIKYKKYTINSFDNLKLCGYFIKKSTKNMHSAVSSR